MGFFKKIFKPVRKVLDKVIPNEIKPYLGTVAATAVPAYFNIPGDAVGDFLAGGGTDILMQKLLYGSDEDRDTDYLSAGMSGILGALAGSQPTQRRVDLKAVRANIERLKIEYPGGSVIIQADKLSKSGLLVETMDQIRLAGIQNISIAAKNDN